MSPKSAYILAAKRSAVAPRLGALSGLSLHNLAAPVIQACLAECGLTALDVEEVIVSNALGAGGNPARLIALASGCSASVAGLSIDRQCVGGVDALALAKHMVVSGHAKIVIAGGVESYSQRPIRMAQNADTALLEPYDRPPFTPWPDKDPDMAVSASELARKYLISRDMQDAFACDSHAKACAHRDQLSAEIVTVGSVDADSYSRALSMALCQRAPVIHETITFANSAVAADGAAFCVVVSEDIATAYAGKVVEIVDAITLGADPMYPALAPVEAINALLHRQGIDADRITNIEMMEAYAVQAMLCAKLTGLNPASMNVKGGALARGHPIGASGAILAVRLFHDLTEAKHLGLAAIAAAGGLGSALLLRPKA